MTTIAVVNRTTLATPEEVKAYVAAQQVQVSRDFGPAYGLAANVVYVGPDEPLPANVWPLILCDSDDSAPDALGWHDVGKDRVPDGVVPLSLSIKAGDRWTATASHEVLEILGDPFINRTAAVLYKRSRVWVAYETADAVENDEYQINGIQVSNFVLPSWFTPGRAGIHTDFLNKLDGKPFPAMSPGGYFQFWTYGKGWQQVLGKHADKAKPGKLRRRSRRERLCWCKGD